VSTKMTPAAQYLGNPVQNPTDDPYQWTHTVPESPE